MTNHRLIYARSPGKIATTHALADRAEAEINAHVGVTDRKPDFQVDRIRRRRKGSCFTFYLTQLFEPFAGFTRWAFAQVPDVFADVKMAD